MGRSPPAALARNRANVEPAATQEKWPKGEYFIFGVQTHFRNGVAIGFRNMEFVRNMGFKLDNSAEAYAFPNFVKQMFFDSETSMIVRSGIPGKEIGRDAAGNLLEGKAARRVRSPASCRGSGA